MHSKKTFQQILGLGLALFLLIGCSAPATVQETQAPAQRNGPKSGHWEGEPSVSFDIGSDGSLQNFQMAASAGQDTCNMEAQGIKVEDDGTFVISEWQELSAGLRGFIDHGVSLGAVKPATRQGDSAEMVESKHVDGKFETPETVSGSYLVTTCEDKMYTTVKVPTWNAAWKKP